MRTPVRPDNLDLRTLAWKLRGIGLLISNMNCDVVPDQTELYGIGEVISRLGRELEEYARTQDLRGHNGRNDL